MSSRIVELTNSQLRAAKRKGRRLRRQLDRADRRAAVQEERAERADIDKAPQLHRRVGGAFMF